MKKFLTIAAAYCAVFSTCAADQLPAGRNNVPLVPIALFERIVNAEGLSVYRFVSQHNFGQEAQIEAEGFIVRAPELIEPIIARYNAFAEDSVWIVAALTAIPPQNISTQGYINSCSYLSDSIARQWFLIVDKLVHQELEQEDYNIACAILLRMLNNMYNGLNFVGAADRDVINTLLRQIETSIFIIDTRHNHL